ncbi:fimbrial biogenesis chaperone [Ramlibacter humi]|uniref:Molecular chaperone n=1 Tax=Ramlibacter humi TaxID=2530451 RepID=A0A4Z0CDH1_9BURK|nr:fimbria/pilus periplasmic chaperone [Ramlibacter humi]TFZ08510.1 molecular chaperone [Ramlibacter humi]
MPDFPPLRSLAAALAAACAVLPCAAGDFSVTPIRAELKAGALNETITVTNHADTKLRASVKLMEWTQDESGGDVYKDSGDLIYFPRQLEIEPQGKRLVRIGAKAPAGVTERTYRLFIEEEPEPGAQQRGANVSFLFRFGVPVFLPPANPKPEPDVAAATLSGGKLSLPVRNRGNQHFRLTKVTFADGAGWSSEATGWYSLAGTQRTYTAAVPPEVCAKARTLTVLAEGEDLRFERSVNVDPAACR